MQQLELPDLLHLFKNGKNLPTIQENLPNQSLQKKIELKKREPPPNPTELELIIVTCKALLNCNLNLDLIARQLKLDDEIKGKKLLGIAEEGLIKVKPKTNKKNKNKKKKRKTDDCSREDFSNQCTIIVHPNGFKKHLNLKLFGNGKIVITGGLSKEYGKSAVTVLKEKIKDLEYDYQIIPEKRLTDLFVNVISYVKYMNKNYLVFLKLFSLYGININLQLDLILNKRLVEKYPIKDSLTGKFVEKDLKKYTLIELINNGIIMSGSDGDLINYSRIIQVFNICHLYFPNPLLIAKLNNKEDPIHSLIKNLYDFKTERLPVTFDKEEFNADFEVTIENYNTMFNIGFNIDREIFTQILNKQYKTEKIISSAKFEPSVYQGINAKYISRIMCKNGCVSLGKRKTSKCPCKEVSFLIFQEGNVIVTGGRSWKQINDGYEIITGIMKNEYYSIVANKQRVVQKKNEQLPPQIIKQTADDKTIVYLNKQQQIIENPRNYFLLKQMNLLEKYI